MTISSKKFHLKSVLACAALALLFTTAQPNTAMALVAAVSDDTPGTVTTPNKGPVHKNPTYKSNVATKISNAIASEKAKALQKRQLTDSNAMAQVDGINKMIEEAKKNGMTDDDIRKELGVVHTTPPTTTPVAPVLTATTPGTYNPNTIVEDLKKKAAAHGWSDEVYQSELKAAMTHYYQSTQ